LGDCGYALWDGDLLHFAADGTMLSRTPIPVDLFARHRERLSSIFHPDTPAEMASAWVNSRATARDGILYCIIRDPSDGVLVKAFEAPA
jgi:hypothetical protein